MTRPLTWLAAALLAFSLAQPAGAAAPTPTRGGTLVFARQVDSQFLDPVHTTQNADIWLSLNLYDTLVLASADGKGVEPGLATAYMTSEDGKTVTFTLRPGIKFADGSAIQPSDVKWSLDRARNKETGGDFAFLLSSIASVEAGGADTVAIHLSHPDPVLLQALATFNAGIMPEKLVMAAPGDTLLDKSKNFAEKPIGSGPFMLTSWKRNNEMLFARNPYYWKDAADGQKLPYLDGIRFVIIPDDATRILKLQAGEVDAAEFVPYARVAELKADPKLDMELFPAAQTNYFLMNIRPELKDGSKNPLADQRVRQALNYATDKDALIQVVSYGTGTPQRSFMPMSTPFSYGPEPLYPYDPAKAKKLLSDAGYASGFPITILTQSGNADDQAKVATLQQLWSAVGCHADHPASRGGDPAGAHQRRRFPDAHQRCGPTTSTTRARSPPSWRITRRGRARGPGGTTSSLRRAVRAEPGRTRPGEACGRVQGDPAALRRGGTLRFRLRGALPGGAAPHGA